MVVRASTEEISGLRFMMCPSDAGQIVEVMYAADVDGLWCRIRNRSDGTVKYQFARYPAVATERDLRFEPQNGVLPRHNKWREVIVS